MPVDGRYFTNVFSGLLFGGIGLALSFVPVTIASLTGVRPADAGVASGLINTSRQIGGSVGLAAVTTIAAVFVESKPSAAPTALPLEPDLGLEEAA